MQTNALLASADSFPDGPLAGGSAPNGPSFPGSPRPSGPHIDGPNNPHSGGDTE